MSSWAVLCVACLPFFYYVLVLYSSWRFFRRRPDRDGNPSIFTPPVSILKPVRGTDPDAYENFASFCTQDYPEYEIVFCVGGPEDETVPVIEKLKLNFPHVQISILFGSLRKPQTTKWRSLPACRRKQPTNTSQSATATCVSAPTTCVI